MNSKQEQIRQFLQARWAIKDEKRRVRLEKKRHEYQLQKDKPVIPPIGYGSIEAEAVAVNQARWRLTLIGVLGGCCEKCGCSDPRVLEIDHRNGDGYIERQRKGYTTSISWRKQALDPKVKDRLACLCANCHRIKTFERDEGHPHRKYTRINPLQLAPFSLPF